MYLCVCVCMNVRMNVCLCACVYNGVWSQSQECVRACRSGGRSGGGFSQKKISSIRQPEADLAPER